MSLLPLSVRYKAQQEVNSEFSFEDVNFSETHLLNLVGKIAKEINRVFKIQSFEKLRKLSVPKYANLKIAK